MAKWPYSTPQWQALWARKLASTPACEYCPPATRWRATCVVHSRCHAPLLKAHQAEALAAIKAALELKG